MIRRLLRLVRRRRPEPTPRQLQAAAAAAYLDHLKRMRPGESEWDYITRYYDERGWPKP